ncbi:PilW family protein [Planctobacterium marinum]|uniref:PilW family protein n=1 Tax=Planctobacterium marinum TaxID=1631968 RepID=UPI001E2B1D59|nr:type II secretion system protein [Planctobacterium marinum]MCC2608029.1 prepilin-type N-terminal cleavage/methylation domain-containing protein [Planctobacterium marinum]
MKRSNTTQITGIFRQQHAGFTLVELIAVIVILGIVSLGVTNFMGNSTQMYVDTAERDDILAKSRYTVERLNRAIRYALPNSIRVAANKPPGQDVNAHCLEFFPIEWSTFYLSIATGADSPITTIEGPDMVSALDAVASGYDDTNELAHYVVVYPTDPSQVYVDEAELIDDDGRIVRVQDVRDASRDGLKEVEFQNAISFDEESTVERFYIVSDPISYCLVLESGSYNLYLLSDYGILPTQVADVDELQITYGATKVLMAQNLTNDISKITNGQLNNNRPFDEAPFRVEDSRLQRNAIVHTLLMFERNDEVVVFNNEIHMQNSP